MRFVIEIFGHTTGLSTSILKQLERVYRKRVPAEQIITRELAQSLCDISSETGRQLGLLIHRSGQIDYVIVGDAGKIMLPDIGRLRAAQGRFRGLRLVHTHLRNEPLTRDDLVDLVRLRLDLVAAIQVQGFHELGPIFYAYNVPQNAMNDLSYCEVGPVRIHRLEVNFLELITNLEAEFAHIANTREVKAKDGRAILVYVDEKSSQSRTAYSRMHVRSKTEIVLRELSELAHTAGVEVVDCVTQHRDRIDPKYILGRGKLEEIVIRAMQLDAETLIFDRELTPSQVTAITSMTDLKIIDRTQLILDIFAQHAHSRDGKLQVELAQLKYALPRLNQKDDALSRLTGGIGGRGPGETKLELGRRYIKERVHHLEQQIKIVAKQREQRRKSRTRAGVFTVALIGYTNAGKSTLLNALTKSDVLVQNKLFATLDTRARQLFVEPTHSEQFYSSNLPIVLVDTVGFIRELPEDLFAAFRATFEEAVDADLIIQVVDASEPAYEEHIYTAHSILSELTLHNRPMILVFNKIDLLSEGALNRLLLAKPEAIFVSAHQRETLRSLTQEIRQHCISISHSQKRATPSEDDDSINTSMPSTSFSTPSNALVTNQSEVSGRL